MTNYLRKRENIISAKLNISDTIDVGDDQFWYTGSELTAILRFSLINISLAGLPLRTRSKKAKSVVCSALGYLVPKSFPKNKPRFSGQKFDLYVQQSSNLQIWNQDIDSERRYVLLILDSESMIANVHVINGIDLALLDNTHRLTQKYQARLTIGDSSTELISSTDTHTVSALTVKNKINLSVYDPSSPPTLGSLLPIDVLFSELSILIGTTLPHLGFVQERNRGAALHSLICQILGYTVYHDNGQFPDIRHQLLEIKLQTSTTIDLGLVCPDSVARLDLEQLNGYQVRHCDIRHAIFYGFVNGDQVEIIHFYLTTGQDFFQRFTAFGNKSVNSKIQLRLPISFFQPPATESQTDLPVLNDE